MENNVEAVAFNEEITKLYEVESVFEKKITKISVFDFDGTLVNTEMPETGKVLWEKSTGNKWPHIGWWGKAESLHIDIFNNEVVPHVIEDYKAEKNGPENLVIMLTGRRTVLSVEVEKILEKHGLDFDRKYYNFGGDTITCKLKTLDSLLVEFPHVVKVEVWEDREPHVEHFLNWGLGRGVEIKVNLVTQDNIEARHK